jgi:hypothetical protein
MAYGSRTITVSIPVSPGALLGPAPDVLMETSLLHVPVLRVVAEALQAVRRALDAEIEAEQYLAATRPLPFHVSGRLEQPASAVLEAFITTTHATAVTLLVAGRFGTTYAPLLEATGYRASAPPVVFSASGHRMPDAAIPLAPQRGVATLTTLILQVLAQRVLAPAVPVGTGGEVKSPRPLPLSVLGLRTVDRGVPIAWGRQVAATPAAGVLEALGAVTHALAAPLEALGRRAATTGLPLATGRALDALAGALLETLKGIARLVGPALEAARTLAPARAATLEAPGHRLVTFAAPIAALGGVTVPASLLLEASGLLARTLSALLGTARTLTVSSPAPIEDVGGTLNVFRPVPFATFAALSVTRSVALESVHALRLTLAAAVEAIAGLTPSPPVPVEGAGDILSDQVANLEAAGRLIADLDGQLGVLLGATDTFPAPTDVLGRRNVTLAARLEAGRHLQATAPATPLDAARKGVQGTASVRLENMSLGLNSFISALVEARGRRDTTHAVVLGVASVQQLIHLATLTGQAVHAAAALTDELARVAGSSSARAGATVTDELVRAGGTTETVGRPSASEIVKP